MSWPFDASTPPHITAAGLLSHFSERLGLGPEDLRLPSTLLGTFQDSPWDHLVSATSAAVPARLAETPGARSVWITSVLIGKTRAGRPVTIAKLPVGAPATAILLEMAIARGVRDILVCGSAGSLQNVLPIGSIVVISAAEREDGTSHHYVPAGEALAADPELSDRLAETLSASGVGVVRGRSWTIDAVFRETAGAIARHQRAGVAVVDMESAAIFAVAHVRGAHAAIAVAVSDELFRPWTPGFHLPAFHAGLERVANGILQVADAL